MFTPWLCTIDIESGYIEGEDCCIGAGGEATYSRGEGDGGA